MRRYTVQAALIWLKCHNPIYFDIIISQERLNQLPENGSINIHTVEIESIDGNKDQGPAPQQVDPGETDGETASYVTLPDPSINIQKQVEQVVEEIVGPEHGPVTVKRNIVTIPSPTRDDIPVSEFTTHTFLSLAFLCLFSHCISDFNMNRPRTCNSLSERADHLMWYRDGRFAQHKYFKFIVHNMIMRKRTSEHSALIVKQQLGDEHLSVSDLQQKIGNGDSLVAEKILYFGACLRGTSQYWAQRSKELISLIQYQINTGKGLPSFFTTGSCAEFHFKALRRLLELYRAYF